MVSEDGDDGRGEVDGLRVPEEFDLDGLLVQLLPLVGTGPKMTKTIFSSSNNVQLWPYNAMPNIVPMV